MSWFYLLIAGLFEIVWAVGLKYTYGFTKFIPSIITIVSMVFSFIFLSLALKTLPIGTAYAVWTGIGVIGTFVIGIFFLGEPKELLRVFFVFLILSGIIGLKVST